MRIGIVGPFNPSEFGKWFDKDQYLPNINKEASSVNALVDSLLEAGEDVVVFTSSMEKQNCGEIIGNKLSVYIVRYKTIPLTGVLRFYVIYNLINILSKHVEAIDVLHAHWTYEYAYAALHFSKNVPVVCTVRDWCPYQLQLAKSFESRLRWNVNHILFKKVVYNPKVYLIANSLYTLRCIKSLKIKRDVIMIPNSIKRKFILTDRSLYPKDVTFISIAQSLTDIRKNVVVLLRAFKKFRQSVPNANLIVTGLFSEDDPTLIKWKEENLLEDVTLAGWVNHDELINILDNSTALIHPSLEETFGNTLIEGMARRCVVVGGENSGAVPQVLGDGKYGIICNIKDEDEILSALCKASKIAENRNIIDRATKYLLETYSSDVIGNKHMDYYRQLISEHKKC